MEMKFVHTFTTGLKDDAGHRITTRSGATPCTSWTCPAAL